MIMIIESIYTLDKISNFKHTYCNKYKFKTTKLIHQKENADFLLKPFYYSIHAKKNAQ